MPRTNKAACTEAAGSIHSLPFTLLAAGIASPSSMRSSRHKVRTGSVEQSCIAVIAFGDGFRDVGKGDGKSAFRLGGQYGGKSNIVHLSLTPACLSMLLEFAQISNLRKNAN